MSEESKSPEQPVLESQRQELPEEKDLITQSEGHHDHFYFWAMDTPYGLREAMCACGHGLQVDTKVHDIVDGKITTVQ